MTTNLAQAFNNASNEINHNTQPPKPQSKKTEIEILRDFVNHNGLFVEKQNGKSKDRFLKAEAWQFIANIKGLIPSATAEGVYDNDGNLVRVIATCKIINKECVELGKSTMIASKSEEFLKDKPDYATYGMAETRAVTRAIRNIYGYLAVSAGFESVPYEEVR